MTRKSQNPSNSRAAAPIAQKSEVRLRNLSGVPVLEVLGDLDQSSVDAVEQLAYRLLQAGHYHLVLNITRARATSAAALSFLGRMAGEARKHYGAITLVTRQPAAEALPPGELGHIIRTCRSEAAALAPLKGVRNLPADSAIGTPARLW